MNEMTKIIFTSVLLLTSTSIFAQSGNGQQTINVVCEGSKSDAILILKELNIEANKNSMPLSIETLRKVYVKRLNVDIEMLNKELKNSPNFSKTYDVFLNSFKSNYKFALCEKYKRRDASSDTIASEAYFLCRETISTGRESRPNPCF